MRWDEVSFEAYAMASFWDITREGGIWLGVGRSLGPTSCKRLWFGAKSCVNVGDNLSSTTGTGFWNAVVPYSGYDYSDDATGSA